jgi:hypothetical protein
VRGTCRGREVPCGRRGDGFPRDARCGSPSAVFPRQGEVRDPVFQFGATVWAPQIFVGPTQREMPAALFNNTQARLGKQPASEGGPYTRGSVSTKKAPMARSLAFSVLVFHFFNALSRTNLRATFGHCSHRWNAFQAFEHLFLAVDEGVDVVGGQLESVAVRDCVGGACFDAVAAENAA